MSITVHTPRHSFDDLYELYVLWHLYKSQSLQSFRLESQCLLQCRDLGSRQIILVVTAVVWYWRSWTWHRPSIALTHTEIFMELCLLRGLFVTVVWIAWVLLYVESNSLILLLQASCAQGLSEVILELLPFLQEERHHLDLALNTADHRETCISNVLPQDSTKIFVLFRGSLCMAVKTYKGG